MLPIFPRQRIPGRLLPILGCALLISCASTAPQGPITPVEEIGVGVQADAIQRLLDQAADSATPQAAAYRLEAVELLLESAALERAERILLDIGDGSSLSPALQIRIALAAARIALAQENPEAALRALRIPATNNIASLPPRTQIDLRELRANALFLAGQYMAAVNERVQLTPLLPDAEKPGNNDLIWEILSTAPLSTVLNPQTNPDSYELRGWLELMRIVSSNQTDIQAQLDAMAQWRNTWTQHSAASQWPAPLQLLSEIWARRPGQIALVLPMQEPLGKAISEGFLSAYYDALAKGRSVPEIKIYDTSFQPEPLILYDQAVDDGVELIIGPLLKDAVRRMQISSRPMPVPTLALNYGDPDGGNPFDLFQFGLAPEDEIIQAADTAWQAGHRNAAVLTPGGGDYQRIQDTFVNYWTGLGGQVVAIDTFGDTRDYSPVVKRVFSVDASEARAASIRNLLPRENVQFVPRRRQDVDFIFLLANPGEGRQIKPTLAFNFADDVPVYAMPSIYDGGINPAANRDLNNVIFNDAPWVLDGSDPLKATVVQTWSAASGPIQRLRAMGVDAYRLYLRMEQMRAYPYTRVSGATGTLYYRPDGGIHRQLHNAVIVNGEANLLTD
ncbi:MAG: penicillin-binding protein activator [Gammaproteobacteria bacterium]